MDYSTFKDRYRLITDKEITPLVQSQVAKLSAEYSLQEIFNAVWYFYIHKKSMRLSSLDTYGLGFLVSNHANMRESIDFINKMQEKRNQARVDGKWLAENPPKVIKVGRQQRKIRREEYNWDE